MRRLLAITDRMEDNADIFARFMNEGESRQPVLETFRRRVYEQIRVAVR